MFNTIQKNFKIGSMVAGFMLVLIQVGCGKSSSAIRTAANNSGLFPSGSGAGTGSGTVNPINFGFGLNDQNNNNVSLPSGSSVPPSQFTQPNPQLGGLSPWLYLQMLLNQFQGQGNQQAPQQTDLRAIINPGQYAFRFGPTNGAGYFSYQYAVQLPATVNLINNLPNSQCAQSLTGMMSGSMQICLNFTQPSVNQPLPIRIEIAGPNFRNTQTLWVLVIGEPQPSPGAGYQILLSSVSGPAAVPPVVTRHAIYQNDSNAQSSFVKIGSDLYVDVLRNDNAPVSAVQSLTAEPAGSATVSPTAVPYRFIVRPLTGGTIALVARGTDQNGNYEARSTIAIPRQISAIWTRSDRAGIDSSDRLAVVCNNTSANPVSIGFTANPQVASGTLFLAPYAQNVRSQIFQRSSNNGFVAMTSSSSNYVANVTLTLDGSAPIGAVTCYGIVYDCDPSNSSSCVNQVRGNHLLGRGAL